MQKIIDQVVDPVAYEQLDQLRAGVLSAREEFEKTIKTVKEFNSELKVSNSLKGVYADMQKLAQAEKDLQKTSSDLIKVNQQLARVETERQRALEAAERVATQKAKTDGQLLSNSAKLSSQQKQEAALTRQITDEYKQMNIALAEAEKRYANLALTGNGGSPQAKVALQEALAIRNMLNQVDKALQRNAFDARNLSRGLGNSMQQIFRELPVLAMNTQTFFLAISNNLPIFFDAIRIAKEEIKAYNADLKAGAIAAGEKAKAEALAAGMTEKQAIASGKAATAEALKNAQFQKAPSLLKLLTQNLFSYQTLLIAGVTLLTVYGGKIVEWAEGLFDGGKKAAYVRKEIEELNKAMVSSNQSVGSEIALLYKSNAALQSNAVSQESKKRIIKDLLSIYPDYNDEIQSEYDKTGALSNVIISQLVPALAAKARAMALEGRVGEIAGKNLDIQQKMNAATKEENRLRAIAADLDAKGTTVTRNAGTSSAYEERASKDVIVRADLQKQAFKELRQEQQLGEQVINEYTKAMVREYEVAQSVTKQMAHKKERIKEEKDYTDEYVKNLELRRKAEIDLQKFLFQSTGQERYRQEARRLELQLEQELRDIRLKERKLTAVELENIELESREAQREINMSFLKDIADYRQAEVKKFEDIEKEMTAIATKEAADRKKAELDALEVRGVGIQSGIETRQRSELQTALRLYQEGTLNKEQYEEEKLRIQQQYEEEALNSAIQFNLDLLKLIGGDVAKQADIWKKIEDLLKKHEDAKTKATEKGIADRQKKEEQDQRERERRMRAGMRALAYIQDQITDILNRGVDNDLAEIENQSKAIEDRKEKELDAIDKTSLAEKDKADLQAQIENEASARQNELQRREIELKQRKARYDRAVAISQTIISGGRAVVAALEAGPIAGPIFAAIIGALAAVQVAKIMATPLPQYRHGRDGGKAEFALVGEAGRERVEHTDGSSYYVDKPTVTYLPEGAKVISNAKLNEEKIQQNAISGNLVVNSQGRLQQSQAMTEDQVRRLETAFAKGQTHFSVQTDWRGAQASWSKHATHQKWIQKNI